MRLYTADAIKEQVHKLLCKDCEETDVCPVCDYRELIDEILDAPTVDAVPLEDYQSMERTVYKLTEAIADAVPVVRCKDCQYRNTVANCERFGGERYVQANSYCSWGERRTDETD